MEHFLLAFAGGVGGWIRNGGRFSFRVLTRSFFFYPTASKFKEVMYFSIRNTAFGFLFENGYFSEVEIFLENYLVLIVTFPWSCIHFPPIVVSLAPFFKGCGGTRNRIWPVPNILTSFRPLNGPSSSFKDQSHRWFQPIRAKHGKTSLCSQSLNFGYGMVPLKRREI